MENKWVSPGGSNPSTNRSGVRTELWCYATFSAHWQWPLICENLREINGGFGSYRLGALSAKICGFYLRESAGNNRSGFSLFVSNGNGLLSARICVFYPRESAGNNRWCWFKGSPLGTDRRFPADLRRSHACFAVMHDFRR